MSFDVPTGLAAKYPDEEPDAVRAAYHQSGHLIAAWVCGYHVASAALHDCDNDRDHLPSVAPRPFPIRDVDDLVRACRGWEHTAIVRCAGPQAESIMVGVEENSDGQYDYRCARCVLDDVTDSPANGQAHFEMARTRARALLLRRTGTLRSVAEMMLRQLIVDGPQLRKTLARLEGASPSAEEE